MDKSMDLEFQCNNEKTFEERIQQSTEKKDVILGSDNFFDD